MLNNKLIRKTDTEYYYFDANFPLPDNVTYTDYENGNAVSSITEAYSYTDLFDVRKKSMRKGSTILYDVTYEYDYENNKSEYYGICTKTTTKMNNNTNIVEEGVLERNYPYANKCIASMTVTRNGVKEKEEYYHRNSNCGGRIYLTEQFADMHSNNSIMKAEIQNNYEDNIVNPREVTYVVTEGNSTSSDYFRNYYEYDNNERIISVQNAENYLTKYKYNGIGNITEVEYIKSPVNSAGNVTDASLGSDKLKLSYNYSTNTITATNENGKVTVYDFDSVGNKYSVTSKSDESTGAKDIVLESYSYDSRLRPIEVISGKANTTYTYDNRDRVLTTKVSDKDTGTVMSNEKYSYVNNSTGLLTTHTLKGDSTAANIVTVTQQDMLGRTVNNKVGNATTTYTYDMLNNVVKEVGVNTKTYEYDSKGNVLKTTETTGSSTIITTATYDMLGNMLTSTDGKGNTTEYTYSGLNWLSSVRMPFDSTRKSVKFYTYDNIGNLISERIDISSDMRRTLTYEYDHRGRAIKTTNDDDEVTIYSFDGVGNMVEMTRDNYKGSDQTTKYEYDRLNRLVKYTDGMGMSETYEYDDYGNMVSKKDRNGKTTTYSYDAQGRCLSESTGSIVNNFTYNSVGNIKSSSNGNATQNYTYNNLGQIATEYTSTAGGHTIVRSYDNWGRNTQNVYKKGSSVYKTQKYGYDGLSRLTSISSEGDNSTKFNGSYTYDNNNNITKLTENNCTITYEYNNANLVTKVNNDGTGSNDTRFIYEYNIDGNIKSVTDINGNKTSYNYDEANRLISEINNKTGGISFTSNYEYDGLGNRIGMNYSENGISKYSIDYTYDNNSRLVSEQKTTTGNTLAINMTEYG
ncbi:MAG: RHS repeat protein [Eubacterium sp.]|nr:RHS repeat protein [Eubacterium sp.]